MSAPGWRTLWVAHFIDPATDRRVEVVVGLITTAAGGTEIAMRVGDDGKTLIAPLQAAAQHAANVQHALAERLKITGEALGGDAP